MCGTVASNVCSPMLLGECALGKYRCAERAHRRLVHERVRKGALADRPGLQQQNSSSPPEKGIERCSMICSWTHQTLAASKTAVWKRRVASSFLPTPSSARTYFGMTMSPTRRALQQCDQKRSQEVTGTVCGARLCTASQHLPSGKCLTVMETL